MDPEMLRHVVEFIEAHDPTATKLKTKFPFRLLADHCFRCCRWAQRLQRLEGGDAEIVTVSALFHDIGKCVDDGLEGHARAGAEICRDYLASIQFDAAKTAIICRVVGNHIHHDRVESVEAKIVSDADLLDEVGALTVLWDALAVGSQESQSYRIVYERLRGSWGPGEAPATDHLHTEAAKRFLIGRKSFYDRFMCNLEYELGLRDDAQP